MMTANLFTLRAQDEVYVDDAAGGDLYYGPVSEDGERPILAPDSEALIKVTTAEGRRFTLWGTRFGTDFARAERFVARIRAAGRIDLDHWNEGRPVYGSDAYVNQDIEAYDLAQEIEDAKWEPNQRTFR